MSSNEARRLPLWAMGLANCPLGFVFGFISTTIGILLAARGVSVHRVGDISDIAFSPSFWAWLLSPVTDVRFTKRAYGFFFATAAAVLLGGAVLLIGDLTAFTIMLTASCFCAVSYGNVLNGLIADALSNAEFDSISGWLMVANLGAAGVFGGMSVLLVRMLPLPVAAFCLAAIVFAPALLLLYFPTPRQPEGRLRENFAHMGRDLKRVFREGRIWVGLVIFLSTASAFSLTNLFSTLGADFHASEKAVTVLNGPAVAVVCSLGCLLAIPLCRRFRRRTVYLAVGVGGAIAAAAMGVLPHTVAIYAAGVLVYNLFQGFSYTAFNAVTLDIVGEGNALSGTMIALLTASANAPISLMVYVEGHVHDRHGLRAMLFTDSASSVIAFVLLLLLVLPLIDRHLRQGQALPHTAA